MRLAPLRRCATRTAELLHESRLADTTTAAEPDQAAVFRVPHSLQLVAKDPQLAIASNKIVIRRNGAKGMFPALLFALAETDDRHVPVCVR